MLRGRPNARLATTTAGVCLLALLSVLIRPLVAGAACLAGAPPRHKCCPSAPSSPAPGLSATANCCVLAAPRAPDWNPQPKTIETGGPSNAETVNVVISLALPATGSIATEFNALYKVISPPIPPLQQACLLLI
jgi:hypothetical protein